MKGAMPAKGCSDPLLNVINLWLADQRSLGEEPEAFVRCMRAQEVADERIVFLLRVVDEVRVGSGVLHHTMDLRHKAGCERHLTGYYQTTPRQWNVAAR
jgi:hypothetical protein